MSVQAYIQQHHQSKRIARNACMTSASMVGGVMASGARWFVGADVKIKSNIWVGAFVWQPFVLLARVLVACAFIRVFDVTMVDVAMMRIREWSDPVMAALDVRNNVPGAATMMECKYFVFDFASSLYAVFSHMAAIVNAICTGPSEQTFLSVMENLITMPYSFASSYNSMTAMGLASISTATLLWLAAATEYYTVGMLSKFLEYWWYGRKERVRYEYDEIVRSVLGKKLVLGDATWWYTSDANLLFEKAVETHGTPQHIAALIQHSPLAKKFTKCKAVCKNGKPCRCNAKYGDYCGRHKHHI